MSYLRTGKLWEVETIHNEEVWGFHRALRIRYASDEWEYDNLLKKLTCYILDKMRGDGDFKENEAWVLIEDVDKYCKKHPFLRAVFDEIPKQPPTCPRDPYYRYNLSDVVRVFSKHLFKITEYPKLTPKMMREQSGVWF